MRTKEQIEAEAKEKLEQLRKEYPEEAAQAQRIMALAEKLVRDVSRLVDATRDENKLSPVEYLAFCKAFRLMMNESLGGYINHLKGQLMLQSLLEEAIKRNVAGNA